MITELIDEDVLPVSRLIANGHFSGIMNEMCRRQKSFRLSDIDNQCSLKLKIKTTFLSCRYRPWIGVARYILHELPYFIRTIHLYRSCNLCDYCVELELSYFDSQPSLAAKLNRQPTTEHHSCQQSYEGVRYNMYIGASFLLHMEA